MIKITKKRVIFTTSLFIAFLGIIISFSSILGVIFKEKENSRIRDLDYSTRVLFLSSYDLSYSIVVDEINGLKKVLEEHDITLDVDFMDTKKIPTEEYDEYIKNFANNLSLKLKNNNLYKVIVLGDDAALDFGIKYKEELFKNIPIVFLGINNPIIAKHSVLNNNITGHFENAHLNDNVDIALKMNPNVKEVIGIFDNTPTGIGFYIQFNELKTKFANIKFTHINTNNYTKYEFIEKISSLDEDSIILFMYAEEFKDSKILFLNEQINLVAENTKVPIYSYTKNGVGKGFVGGKIVDFEKIGEHVAETVYSIISGKNIEYINLCDELDYPIILDYKVIKKHNLNYKNLEKNIILINKKSTTFNTYKATLIPLIFLVISCFIFTTIISILLISERKHLLNLRKKQDELRYIANHDLLTGLPNRHTAISYFYKLIKKKEKFSLILIDLDDFKSINDFYSHTCGDFVLSTISKRFKSRLSESRFFICRFGGDEFVLIYSNGYLEEDSSDFSNLISVFAEPIIYKERKLYIQSSIGIVNSSSKFSGFETYITNADVAMYHSKKNGKNQITFYTEDIHQSVKNNQDIISILKEAIENDGFNVLYQPQIDVNTGKINGYEALARLKDKPISPDQFIPVAEESGLIVKLSRIITEKVVQQISLWRKHQVELHKVYINYSYGQIRDNNYVTFLNGLLNLYDISPSLIGIEITESLFIENKEKSLALFQELSNLGISIALDDFGTGYSSLNYLTYLPINTVKLDKSLIDNYLNDEKGIFIKNIVRLVHSLEMKLTVEGVENKWQYEKLKDYQCDYIQGFLFSRPISGDEIEDYKNDFVS